EFRRVLFRSALIFGNWRPLGVGAGAGLFGYADALQLRSNSSILALLLFVSIAMAAACGWLLVRKRTGPALAVAVLAGLIFWWHATATKVANEWIAITPYIVTLAVLAMAAQRLRPPAADGRRYRKGQVETLVRSFASTPDPPAQRVSTCPCRYRKGQVETL